MAIAVFVVAEMHIVAAALRRLCTSHFKVGLMQRTVIHHAEHELVAEVAIIRLIESVRAASPTRGCLVLRLPNSCQPTLGDPHSSALPRIPFSSSRSAAYISPSD